MCAGSLPKTNMINWSYITNHDNSARYSLGKIGTKVLFCIGINPSTATPVELDPTLRRVDSFAFQKGYEGWIMLNVYPQRSTDPKFIHAERDEEIHLQNVQTAKLLLDTHANSDVWAAWGVEIDRRNYLMPCLREIAEAIGHSKNWLRMGSLTKEGHPKHPLYLSNKSQFEPFNITSYLQNYN